MFPSTHDHLSLRRLPPRCFRTPDHLTQPLLCPPRPNPPTPHNLRGHPIGHVLSPSARKLSICSISPTRTSTRHIFLHYRRRGCGRGLGQCTSGGCAKRLRSSSLRSAPGRVGDSFGDRGWKGELRWSPCMQLEADSFSVVRSLETLGEPFARRASTFQTGPHGLAKTPARVRHSDQRGR